MNRSSLSGLFKSGVGRRIFLLFMIAAILPVAFTAYFSYDEVHRGLKQEVFNNLRDNAKNFGLEILARIEEASQKADIMREMLDQDGHGTLARNPYLLQDIDAVWRIAEDGERRAIHGEVPLPNFDFEQVWTNLAAGSEQLIHLTGLAGTNLTLLKQSRNTGGQRTLLAFTLNEKSIWTSRTAQPSLTDFCVMSNTNVQLYCTDGKSIDRAQLAAASADAQDGTVLEWDHQGEAQLSATWRLFIRGPFNHPGFNMVATQSAAHALRSSADFRRIFLPSLALVFILAAALSLNLVGKSLMPLRRLTLAANQLARGSLSCRVRMKSGDEFEELADSFNFMAERLQTQIGTLQAMSEIDRLILTGAEFEEVSKDVIRYLLVLTDAESAAVIVRDPLLPTRAKMISSAGGEVRFERINVPKELGVQWSKPKQVLLTDSDRAVVPYSGRFLACGHNYVAIIPVVLKESLKGIVLLGSPRQLDMSRTGIGRAIDLSGRLAVALSSAEREEALYRQAHFDELTGLPNRQLLKDRLEQLLVQVRREKSSGAMLFLDLDRFKEINDVYGHSIGDVVLTQAAERIVAEVRDSDTVARLGGDEFVVVMPKIENHGSVSAAATRLLRVLAETFSVAGRNHFLSASIGVVVFPEDGDSVETLLKNADSAMYRAKEAGRSRFEFFSEELNVESRRKINLERDLRNAYNDNQLEVQYQPQFDLSTGVISGAEALLRWRHQDHGYVSPAEFVPLAEESDLIVDIGQWVIERAVHDLHAILEMGLHPGPVAINVSARQLSDTDFPRQVLEPLQRYNVHPGFLELEITETTVAQNRDTAVSILNVLRDASVKVAIDDFGTGYSSLSYLQHMPFDVIKIDKSFIDLIGTGERGENICRTIIRMAHELGKEAVAEGVETSEQADFLLSNNCDFVQGYFYSKVLKRDDFVKFIEKQDFHTQRRKALELV